MSTFVELEIDRVNLNESTILAFEFANEGLDLDIKIDWCGQKQFERVVDFFRPAYLKCTWVHHLRMHVVFPGNTYSWEIGEFDVERSENESTVRFQFINHPVGELAFVAADVKFLAHSHEAQQ